MRHPGCRNRPVPEALGEPAAGDRSDGHADQQPEEHQRGSELGVRIHGRLASTGMSSSAAMSAAPDCEVGQQRAVGAAETKLGGRDERIRARAAP